MDPAAPRSRQPVSLTDRLSRRPEGLLVPEWTAIRRAEVRVPECSENDSSDALQSDAARKSITLGAQGQMQIHEAWLPF